MYRRWPVGTQPLGYMPSLGVERRADPELAVTDVRHVDPKWVGPWPFTKLRARGMGLLDVVRDLADVPTSSK